MESNNELLIVLSGLGLVASIYWWWRFSRMMDDVHRIAEAIAPKPKPDRSIPKPLTAKQESILLPQFRDNV
jgi:hypothetical protein